MGDCRSRGLTFQQIKQGLASRGMALKQRPEGLLSPCAHHDLQVHFSHEVKFVHNLFANV